MYRVIKYFTDLKDNNHPYKAGDEFPRNGAVVSEKRLEELSTDKNKRGFPLIEKVVDEPVPEEQEQEDGLLKTEQSEQESGLIKSDESAPKPKSRGRKKVNKDAE